MSNDSISQEGILKNIQEDIRLRLRKLQDTLNLTQEEIAKLGARKRISYAEYIREQNPVTPGADFIANLALNTGVNANWLLTGQGEMFNPESSAVETGMQELWSVYQRLGEKERSLLLEVAKSFSSSKS